METSSKSLGQQQNYTVKNTQSFKQTEKINCFLQTRRKDVATLSARARQCTGATVQWQEAGGMKPIESLRPVSFPKCRAWLFLEPLPCRALQQPGPLGCLLRALFVSGN